MEVWLHIKKLKSMQKYASKNIDAKKVKKLTFLISNLILKNAN